MIQRTLGAVIPLKQLGQEIKVARIRVGLTQEELAEQTGVSRDSVSVYERGAGKRPPPRDWIERVVEITGSFGLWEAAGYAPPPTARQGIAARGDGTLEDEQEIINWLSTEEGENLLAHIRDQIDRRD